MTRPDLDRPGEVSGEGPDLVQLHGWSLGGMLALEPAALAEVPGFLARHPDGETD